MALNGTQIHLKFCLGGRLQGGSEFNLQLDLTKFAEKGRGARIDPQVKRCHFMTSREAGSYVHDALRFARHLIGSEQS
jgi:hypothetical protein